MSKSRLRFKLGTAFQRASLADAPIEVRTLEGALVMRTLANETHEIGSGQYWGIAPAPDGDAEVQQRFAVTSEGVTEVWLGDEAARDEWEDAVALVRNEGPALAGEIWLQTPGAELFSDRAAQHVEDASIVRGQSLIRVTSEGVRFLHLHQGDELAWVAIPASVNSPARVVTEHRNGSWYVALHPYREDARLLLEQEQCHNSSNTMLLVGSRHSAASELLEGKRTDTIGGLIGAYVLTRTSYTANRLERSAKLVERLFQFEASPDADHAWLPDAAILHAELALASGRMDNATASLVRAGELGLPIFREGFERAFATLAGLRVAKNELDVLRLETLAERLGRVWSWVDRHEPITTIRVPVSEAVNRVPPTR